MKMPSAQSRPAQKIIFGDRYIGGDSDLLSWKEGIGRLAGLGFNAMYPVPANLTPALREVGINKTWGAVYNPPGYAFNFKPTRGKEFSDFVKEQVAPRWRRAGRKTKSPLGHCRRTRLVIIGAV